jgi:hypothetical protein
MSHQSRKTALLHGVAAADASRLRVRITSTEGIYTFVNSTCASAFVDVANEARSASYSSPFLLIGFFQKALKYSIRLCVQRHLSTREQSSTRIEAIRIYHVRVATNIQYHASLSPGPLQRSHYHVSLCHCESVPVHHYSITSCLIALFLSPHSLSISQSR